MASVTPSTHTDRHRPSPPVTAFDEHERSGPRGRPLLRNLLVGGDVAAVTLSWSAAIGLGGQHELTSALELIALLVITHLLSLRHAELYRARVSAVRSTEIARLGRATGQTTLVGLIFHWVLGAELTGWQMGAGAAVSFIALLTSRSAYRVWLANQRRAGSFTRRVVIVGANEEAAGLIEIARDHPELGVVVVAVVGDETQAAASGLTSQLTGGADQAGELISQGRADGAIIAVSAFDIDTLNRLSRDLLRAGAHVQVTSSLRGIDQRRLQAQPMAFEPLFHLQPVRLSRLQLALKRSSDVVLASILLVLTLPLMAVLAAAVKANDRGPVLFRQQRVGRHGSTFEILKIRTMVVDAEARMAELMAANERNGPLFKMDRDPRLTPIGRVLDATSLNELPQLWNVLRGDMSLVGPRPALPRETEDFDDALHARHVVRPGITGLWQVEARDNPSFSAYRRFDLYYVENWSLALDLVIMIATIEAVLSRLYRMLVRH